MIPAFSGLRPLRPLLSALLGAAFALAASSADTGLFNSVVVAKGRGLEVTRGQLDDAFVAYKANLASRGQNIPEERRVQAEAQLLDRLIVSQILVTRATPGDKSKAREAAEKFFEGMRKNAASDENFLRQLKAMGLTAQQFTNRIMEQAIAEEIINREIKTKIVLPPDAVRQFYETNDALFRQPEMARISHILISTRDLSTRRELSEEQKKAKREKAQQILARARKGEDFTKLAEEVSEDPGVKENKGEYKFARAKDDPRRAMVPEVETAAFAMRPGDISDLVTTDYGYHILKLHEITPARKTPLTELQERIKEHLLTQEMERLMPPFFQKLKDEAQVEILDEQLSSALKSVGKSVLRDGPIAPR